MKIIELVNISGFEFQLVWENYAKLFGFIQLQIPFVECYIQSKLNL